LLTLGCVAELPQYRITARHTYRTTEVQQNWPQRAFKAGKYGVTEIPNAVNTANRKAVNAEISIAVYAEIRYAALQQCRVTAGRNYRDTAILQYSLRDGTAHDYHTCQF
jgi:hypothetical protein